MARKLRTQTIFVPVGVHRGNPNVVLARRVVTTRISFLSVCSLARDAFLSFFLFFFTFFFLSPLMIWTTHSVFVEAPFHRNFMYFLLYPMHPIHPPLSHFLVLLVLLRFAWWIRFVSGGIWLGLGFCFSSLSAMCVVDGFVVWVEMASM